jgi:DNA ligase (NAD+)
LNPQTQAIHSKTLAELYEEPEAVPAPAPAVLAEIAAPTTCPECTQPIREFKEPRSGIVTHWCINDYCPGRLKDMLTYVADRSLLEIDALGPELATALVSGGFVNTLADLFETCNELQGALTKLGDSEFSRQVVLRNGLPAAATISMIRSMDRAKTANWDRWIAALGIPSIGLQLGKVLGDRLKLESEDMGRLPEKLMEVLTLKIDRIGLHKLAAITEAAKSDTFRDNCARLYAAGVRPKSVAVTAVAGAPLEGMSFVITGEFHTIGSREYITSKLVSLGAVSKSGVTKKVTHLLVGEEPGKTKLNKAAELNIPHLSLAWLTEQFEKYGFSTVGDRFMVEDV